MKHMNSVYLYQLTPVNNGYNKYVLRESMKNIIRKNKLDRKKKGFKPQLIH